MFLFESVDSMVLYHLILILFSNIFFSIVGLLSHSRYAIIATIRGLVHVISLDIFGRSSRIILTNISWNEPIKDVAFVPVFPSGVQYLKQ